MEAILRRLYLDPSVSSSFYLTLDIFSHCFRNGNTNASATPLACPQSGVDASTYSEDCLSMILYVPTSAVSAKTKLPIMMWYVYPLTLGFVSHLLRRIHGGSFILGSATGPGLDGSNLATATGAIVAVVQYRLGALGFMAPDGSTNLAVGDIVTALKFLQTIAPSFGGDASQITLAGQSSGANMIRAMLAVPSAASLFKQAIIQSDPMVSPGSFSQLSAADRL